MGRSDLHLRPACIADAPVLTTLIHQSVERLLAPVLAPDQVASSHRFMALDTQLIADATYFVVESDGLIVGCGGWSRRATAYGGDSSTGRDPRLLDPASEPARIRAMYTHPDFTRRGIGRLILRAGEEAARMEGFRSILLAATIGGEPLYRACGYVETCRVEDGGVPIIRMKKELPS